MGMMAISNSIGHLECRGKLALLRETGCWSHEQLLDHLVTVYTQNDY